MLWHRRNRSPRLVGRRQSRLGIEHLEQRTLLSVVPADSGGAAHPPTTHEPTARGYAHPAIVRGHAMSYASPPAGAGVSPAQIEHAYGFDQLSENGAGQTIAIVDPYDDANILADLSQFDSQFGIQNPPTFNKVGQDGSMNLPGAPPANGYNWDFEISLDVEWAHALAPAANILLVEANSNSFGDLFAAVNTARTWTGVSAVSLSWGGGEYNGETSYDSTLTTPAGHTGVVFLAADGDKGSPSSYPATSPNVVGVGGTTLSIDGSGDYGSETTWNDVNGKTAGGLSTVEIIPYYQEATINASNRATPDVSFASDENVSGTLTGVWIVDSHDYPGAPWVQAVGTSFSTPAWAAIIARADQARASANLSALDGASEALPTIYALQGADLHDITTGSNGTNSAGTGYDLVTGRGTPIATAVVPDLVRPLSPVNEQRATGAQLGVDFQGSLSQQDLFTVGSDGLVREDVYDQSTHTESGQFLIDPSTTFSSGSRLTVYDDGASINVFAVGADGRLKWAQHVNGGAWSPFVNVDGFIPGNTITLNGGINIVAYAYQGVLSLFAVQTNGDVRAYQYVASSRSWTTGLLPNTLVYSGTTQLAGWGSGGYVDLFGVLNDGTIGQWQYVPYQGWNHDIIQAGAAGFDAGTPLAVWEMNGVTDLFGIGKNGILGQAQNVYGHPWTAGPVLSGSYGMAPDSPLGIWEGSGYTDLFAVNQNGQLVQFQNVYGHPWGAATFSNSPLFVPGSQVTVDEPSGVTEVFGRGANGHIVDEEYSGAWQEYDLG